MKIVAAVDASKAARKVLERAIAQSHQTGARLHVVHVFQPPATVYPMQGMYLADDEKLEDLDHAQVWEMIGDLLEGSSLDWTRSDLRGYPASAIVEYARQVGADLVVVGTRGLGGFASLVLGSTSQAVIHDAPCDVLVVKTGAEE